MKLLFDHNLSPALVERLSDVFPGSEHVFLLGLDEADDLIICEFAVEKGFAFVTKDADYSELLSLRKTSTKLIWIRKGNCSTHEIEALLRFHSDQINSLEGNESVELLMLF